MSANNDKSINIQAIKILKKVAFSRQAPPPRQGSYNWGRRIDITGGQVNCKAINSHPSYHYPTQAFILAEQKAPWRDSMGKGTHKGHKQSYTCTRLSVTPNQINNFSPWPVRVRVSLTLLNKVVFKVLPHYQTIKQTG